MPFKSDKQRKWMHANEPDMAKKWEKEEVIRGKLRNLIKQEIKSINEGWWEDLSDKAQAAYIKKHGAAPNSSGKKEDEMGDHIRKGIAKDKKGRAKMKKLNRDYDAKTSTASDIAKDMGGNMTGAVKKIEKIKKGLSDDPKVKAALRRANESVDKETITEASVKTGWKLYHVYDINSKLWKEMKYDLRDQFDELVKIGADYGVFQDAQGTAKILKQIKRLMDKI